MKHFLLLLALIASAPIDAQESLPATKLINAEKLLFTKPDSAHVLIEEALNVKQQHDTFYSKANIYNGYYYLLKNKPDSSIYFYERALGYAQGYPSYKGRVLRLMSSPYRKKGNYDKSLQLLARAENAYAEIGDSQGLATVYAEMAANYNAMLRPQDAIPYLSKAIGLFEKAKNKKDLVPVKQSLANTYLNIGNYQFAADLYVEILKGFREIGMPKNYYLTLINYSECLINLKQNDAARTSLLEAISGLEKFGDKELIGSAYATLGRLETQKMDFLAGEQYYNKAFIILSSVNSPRAIAAAGLYIRTLTYFNREERAREIIALVDSSTYKARANVLDLAAYEKAKMEFYKKTDDSALALESAKTAVALLDTLGKLKDEKAVITMQAGIQQDLQDRKSDTLTQSNKELQQVVATVATRNRLWVYIPIAVLASVLTYLAFSSLRHRKKMAMSKDEVQMLKGRFESSRQENEALKSQFKEHQSELRAGSDEIDKVNAGIVQLIDRFGQQTRTSSAPDLETVKRSLEGAIPDKDYWDLFRKNHLLANKHIVEKLQGLYPGLNKNELFFCTLLRLSLPNKDLAIILQITPDAVKKKKNRLRKKIEINPGDNLEQILNDVSS